MIPEAIRKVEAECKASTLTGWSATLVANVEVLRRALDLKETNTAVVRSLIKDVIISLVSLRQDVDEHR